MHQTAANFTISSALVQALITLAAECMALQEEGNSRTAAHLSEQKFRLFVRS